MFYTFYCVVTTHHITIFLFGKQTQILHISQFRHKHTNTQIILVLGKSNFPITNYVSRASTCNAFGSLAPMLNLHLNASHFIQVQFIIQSNGLFSDLTQTFLVWIQQGSIIPLPLAHSHNIGHPLTRQNFIYTLAHSLNIGHPGPQITYILAHLAIHLVS